MATHNELGKWGEQVAERHLLEKDYRIVQCNWHYGHRDIDIIAAKGDMLVFVEVKTRKSADFAMAREHVDFRKQERLKKTAALYLSQNPSNLQPRFDVIEIYAPQGHTTLDPKITHLEDAFQ